MNFKSLPEDKNFKKGKFIRPGVQNLFIRDITLQKSPNTGNERPVFSMETEPITDEGWEGHEGSLGQIGYVAGNYNYYLKTQEQKEDFAGNLRDIMKATNTYEAFMEKHGETNFDLTSLEGLVDAVRPFLIGTKARYFVCGEQYVKLSGAGTGIKLKLPSRRFVETLDSESRFPKFNESDPKHYKKLDKNPELSNTRIDGDSIRSAGDDLPF